MGDAVDPPDSGLPVEGSISEVREALATAGAAVLSAEPGAGKTTIVPLRLLGEPWVGDARIVMLEPRRVAARAAARRMAALMGDEVGGVVGYRTRDERRVSERTRIEVVTEAMLTRRLQSDPELGGTALVIFDEFHERNLHADLGLALTLDVRRSLRPDLRILVMSATLDMKRVAAHLGDAPIVTSPGRTHPIDVRWAPRAKNDRLEPATATTLMRALREEDGDVLVFLPGAAEIRRTADALVAGGADRDADIRPLYGALPTSEQDAALEPATGGRRKIVLATDIAETSLTVEGVRVVVDAGLARVPRFDVGTGMTRLTTITASKASAEQRAGRAGRLGPGVVYRLWSKIEHAARRPHIDPEIGQVDLAGLVLELAAWGVTDPSSLPFLDAPPRRAVEEARSLLDSLGAIDRDGRATETGRRMVALPLHPRLSKMVVASIDRADGWIACLLAALLEARDVLRGRPDERPADIDLRLRLLDDPTLRYPDADGRALAAVRRDAHDVARRARIEPGGVQFDHAGRVLSTAYPDRIAQNRGGTTPGRFKLRNGHGAYVSPNDVLAGEPFVVAADLDGQRRDARLRLGAPISHDDVIEMFATTITQHVSITWDNERDDVVARAERKLGQLNLGVVDMPVEPGPATERLLREQLNRTNLAMLTWTPPAKRLRARLAFLHRHRAGDGWPDVSKRGVLNALDLSAATSRRDVAGIDVARVLRGLIPPALQNELDRLAPDEVRLPRGRAVAIDYSDHDQPHIEVIVQDAFGLTATPTVLDGAMRIVVHLLSPARRPVQVTSDLEGFWAGSWRDVRKEMAGRYPKHAWPEDPGAQRG